MAYIAVILACFCWALATQGFAKLGNTIGVWRLNLFKTIISLFLFGVVLIFEFNGMVTQEAIGRLFLSGFLGYVIGDLLMFRSLSAMGPTKTLMLNPIHPIMLSILSYLFLDLTLSPGQFIGLLFFFPSVFFLSQDKDGIGNFRWKWVGVTIMAMFFDALGMILTKSVYMQTPDIATSLVIEIRLVAALILFVVATKLMGRKWNWSQISTPDKKLVFTTTFLGTFLALYLVYYALKYLHPSIVSSVTMLSPLISSFFECYREKKKPSFNLVMSFLFMATSILLISFPIF